MERRTFRSGVGGPEGPPYVRLFPYDELLYPFPFERLACIYGALSIGRDAADTKERTRIAAAGAEAADRRERIAAQDVHCLILSVCDEDELLLRIARERDVPRRAVAERGF